jgi:penicillin-binding protein 2
MLHDRIEMHFQRRLWLLGAFFTAAFAFLAWRLWQVQMRHAEKYDDDVSRQCIRRILLPAVRGRIFAADGTVLVDNRVAYDLVFHPGEMRRPGAHGKNSRENTLNYLLEQAGTLAARLKRPAPLTRDQLKRHLDRFPAMGLPVFQDLTPAEVAILAELSPPLPGIEIVPRTIRTYPRPGMASHILGFTARQRPPLEAGDDEDGEEDAPRFAYLPPELVGRQGLELACNDDLCGQPGEKLVQVDIRGYIHSEIGMPIPPQHGGDLILTLDPYAQAAAEKALRSMLAPGGQAGALVALDVNTGAVVAMASWPTYNLATLTPEAYRQFAEDRKQRPLFNRAVSGSYQPGSIVKPLTALAALLCGAMNPGDTTECTGAYMIGSTKIRCWKSGGHGTVDMVQALAQSCNSYFMHAGLKTGLERLLPVFEAAGFGQETGLELGGASGFLPSRAWSETVEHRPWTAADTAFLSIGQGPVTLSPLQAAMFTAAIANGGTVFRPYLVQSVRNPDGTLRRQTAALGDKHLPVMQKELEVVRRGMWEAVHGTSATAASARNAFITLAGKTGTAETGRSGAAGRIKDTWFIGYGPVEAPKYAVAIIVEGGESGGHTASPIARKFFEGWLGARRTAPPAGAAAEPPAPEIEVPEQPAHTDEAEAE